MQSVAELGPVVATVGPSAPYHEVAHDHASHPPSSLQQRLPIARAAVARRVGGAVGTLENLRRGRIKGVRAWIAEALRDALVKELKSEIAAHEHELAILLAGARHPDRHEVAEIEAGVTALKDRLQDVRS